MKAEQQIYFNSRDRLIRVELENIVYFEGDGNYTYMITVNNHKTCLTINLLHTEEALAKQLGEHANRLMRIGKRFIVNMRYIHQVDLQKQVLILSDCRKFLYQLPISKEALKVVKDIIIQSKI